VKLAANEVLKSSNCKGFIRYLNFVVLFRLLVQRSGTAYQTMSPPLRPCQPIGAIWRHTYSAAVTTLSDSAVLTVTIVVLVVALLLRPL